MIYISDINPPYLIHLAGISLDKSLTAGQFFRSLQSICFELFIVTILLNVPPQLLCGVTGNNSELGKRYVNSSKKTNVIP